MSVGEPHWYMDMLKRESLSEREKDELITKLEAENAQLRLEVERLKWQLNTQD
jgi:hypothetical protein